MRTITLVVRNEYSFLQENFGIYLNEYISGCLDGTYKTPEYNLEDEIEKEMEQDFYDDDYLDTDTANNLNTFTNNLIKGKRRYDYKKEKELCIWNTTDGE